jgi:2,3-bisphosphoglycerate-dependent phosphoglycerate mutase
LSWPRRIAFVRHAESEGNVLSVDDRASFDKSTHAYGLTEHGRWQASVTGRWLKANLDVFDFNFVSYYRRSQETMEIMHPGVSNVVEDARLAEAQRGIYHAMTRDQIAEKYPEELTRKEREGLYHYRPPGGENWLDVELRIHSFFDTLIRDHGGQNILLVGHGHWILMAQKIIEKHSSEVALKRYPAEVVPNASVTIYECIPGSRTQFYPVMTHDRVTPWKEAHDKQQESIRKAREEQKPTGSLWTTPVDPSRSPLPELQIDPSVTKEVIEKAVEDARKRAEETFPSRPKWSGFGPNDKF